jgi:hypothetical protein
MITKNEQRAVVRVARERWNMAAPFFLAGKVHDRDLVHGIVSEEYQEAVMQ